ncbi:MAG: hypothetical protein H0X33_10930 [Taibaiella sp.]|nr:hypothetical protein [Taibaiella sp.]
MCRYPAKYLLLLILIALTIPAGAQTSSVSDPLSAHVNLPYSRFGVGELWNGNNTLLKGMGNISSAYADPYAVNADNPASFGFLRLTTYEAGAQADLHTLTTNTANYTTGTATLSYMNFAVPIGKHVGLCIGIRPYSNVFYNLQDTTYSDTLIGKEVIRNFTGGGSVNYAYIGGAYQYKGFSIGATFGYMFGSINNASRLLNQDTTKSYNATFIQSTHIGGIYWKGGAIYQGTYKKDYTYRIGGTVTLQQDLNATRNEYWIGTYNLVDTFIADTSYAAHELRGKITLPMTYSFGVQFAKTHQWMIGVDYTATQWNQFRNLGSVDSVASTSYRVSLGGEVTPNSTALNNYFSRITYRLGFYYGTNYVYLRNTTLANYGLTFGGSLPFKRTSDRIHLAFDIGKLGTTDNNLIKDTYIKFSAGISLNALWFVKRKYE